MTSETFKTMRFSGGDPFATLEEDERFAVPSIEDVKKMKRLGKSHSRNDGRSNVSSNLLANAPQMKQD